MPCQPLINYSSIIYISFPFSISCFLLFCLHFLVFLSLSYADFLFHLNHNLIQQSLYLANHDFLFYHFLIFCLSQFLTYFLLHFSLQHHITSLCLSSLSLILPPLLINTVHKSKRLSIILLPLFFLTAPPFS